MKPKVLLVDDEKLNLMTFEAFLADDGYELHCAEDGRIAIELARAISPDLILLDVMMPGLDGFAVCQEIRRDPELGHVPIIIVTALHDSASRLQGLQAGADDFLTKPCSRDEIRARVRTIVSLNRFRTIAEQRARFEQLYDSAPVAIVVTDENGVVQTANPLAEALLAGVAKQLLPGRCLEERFGPDAATVVAAAIAAALSNDPLPAQEVRRETVGARQILSVRATSIPEAGRRRAMLIFNDVTSEVQARETVETMNRALDELVRARTRQLEEANELLLSYASFVSHDLRSPLSVVKGYLSMVQEGAVPLAEAGRIIEGAYNGTIMMQELVQNILQLAQEEHAGARAGSDIMTDPTPIVQHVWSHVMGLFPHQNRRFTVKPLLPVNASALLIERVFYNLMTNAAKYSLQREEPVIEVGVMEMDAGSAIYIRDNGVGFDHRDADKLFREFSRLPGATKGEGLGLGLSLAARLVRGHGGQIWAEGQAGNGATFYVQFGEPTVAKAAIDKSA